MRKYFAISLLFIGLTSCWPSSVSFSDTGSNPCLKKFTMSVLDNNAPNAPINYATDLTEAIKTGLQNNTRLLITDPANNPEIIIEGAVTNYLISPIALQQGDNAEKNRLTISAQFKLYLSCKEDNYEEEMTLVSTRFVDFNSNEDISAVQADLLADINTQIVQDVINKLLSNW